MIGYSFFSDPTLMCSRAEFGKQLRTACRPNPTDHVFVYSITGIEPWPAFYLVPMAAFMLQQQTELSGCDGDLVACKT